MRRRNTIIYGIVIISFLVVLLRLFDLIVIEHDRFSKRAEDQSTTLEEVQVRRGLIFDRTGRRLAVNLEQNSVYCYKRLLKASDEQLTEMAQLLGIDYDNLKFKLENSRNFFWLKRKVPVEITEKLNTLSIGGIGVSPEAKRDYTMGTLASHVIGFVDIDNKGIDGIEKLYNGDLIDKGGTFSVEKDARGNKFYTENMRERKGKNMVLTIDVGLQYIVERELELALEKWKAESATVVMLNPYNGEILAIANRPTYDPNEAGKYNPSNRRNRAITDLYEPGSTFKIVATSGTLEEKLVKPTDMIDCSAGAIDVGGKRIKDAHRHGVLSFMQVIQKSSNVGTIKLAQRLGKDTLYKYIKLFGFGKKTGIDLPGELPGTAKHPKYWSGVSIGAMAIGQEVGVTPLQVVTAYSVIANGGYAIQPHVVRGFTYDDTTSTLDVKEDEKKRLVSKNTVATMRAALMMVTQQGGTATYAEVEGNHVAGKTGTAQIFDRQLRHYSSTDYVSSFVGFVPAEKPVLSMIVVVWKPRGAIYGGVVAAPIFKNIAEKALSYLNIPREDMEDSNKLYVDNAKTLIDVSYNYNKLNN
ncbi:MAG: penicillin-binding protein 2 [Candidatus Magnetoovum sp. WYHC-5]|nr:penicillin-binding protein 2 [Candidatus Magnetoovum sp. WYHC-5]